MWTCRLGLDGQSVGMAFLAEAIVYAQKERRGQWLWTGRADWLSMDVVSDLILAGCTEGNCLKLYTDLFKR